MTTRYIAVLLCFQILNWIWNKVPETEHEKTYSYPLDIQLKFENKRVQVKWKQDSNWR